MFRRLVATNWNSVLGNNLLCQVWFGNCSYPGFLLSQTLGISGEFWESWGYVVTVFGGGRTLPLTYKNLETVQFMRPLMMILEVHLVCKYRNTVFSGLFQAASGFCWLVTGCYQTGIFQRTSMQSYVRKWPNGICFYHFERAAKLKWNKLDRNRMKIPCLVR